LFIIAFKFTVNKGKGTRRLAGLNKLEEFIEQMIFLHFYATGFGMAWPAGK
jgi:hypothetical protein